MQFKDRLTELADLVDSSPTEKLRQHRADIFNRLVGYIEQSNGDDQWVYKKTIAEDWSAFCALELTTKEGIPLFLSPWQVQVDGILDASDDHLIIAARQIGKTTQAASEYLKRMMRRRNRRIVHFAPTIDQLVVCDTLIPFIRNSDFIRREYGATTTVLSAEFEANGSTFDAINLNETGGNTDKKRGNNGTDIGIDEYQMMSQETWDAIVQPMLSNRLAGVRRVIKWGTVSTKYRPDFDLLMRKAYDQGPAAFSRVNCWQAVDEGIRSPTEGPGSMRTRFRDLNIGCKYVLEAGVCPRYLPHWFEGLEDKVPARVLDKLEPDEFHCNLVCTRSNAYLEEDMGLVGQSESRWFPDRWLLACAKPYRFYTPAEISRYAARPRFASADLGLLQDPTEILVAEGFEGPNAAGKTVRKAKIIGAETVQPFSKTKDAGEPSWDRVVAAIKRVDSIYHPQVWYIDTTRNTTIIKELTTGPNALARARIFANEAAAGNETRGVWWSGPEKAKLYENHQQVIADERLWFPDEKSEPQFFTRWVEDHKNVRRKENSSAQYTTFEDTGHIVDSAVMLSLWLANIGVDPACLEFAFLDDDFNDIGERPHIPSAYFGKPTGSSTYLGVE